MQHENGRAKVSSGVRPPHAGMHARMCGREAGRRKAADRTHLADEMVSGGGWRACRRAFVRQIRVCGQTNTAPYSAAHVFIVETMHRICRASRPLCRAAARPDDTGLQACQLAIVGKP